MLLLVITFIMAIPVIAGFVISRKQRRIDRQHLAAFVGFSGGIVSIGATITWILALQVRYPSPTQQGLLFSVWIIGIISSLVAFFAGFFGRGLQRFLLITYGIVMGFVYLLGIVSNFGA